MSKTLAFGLSAFAGIILWIAQANLLSLPFPPEQTWYGFNIQAFMKLGLSLILVGLVTCLLFWTEIYFEGNPYRKYRMLGASTHLVMSHWLDAHSPRKRALSYHQEMVRQTLSSLARVFDKALAGADFQVSIMAPNPDNPDELQIAFGQRSDAGHMIAYHQDRRFKKGEGYCGTAWYEMAPQTGNGKRRLLFLQDPRFSISRPEGHVTENKSYFAVPIPAPRSMEQDILGILSIDSSNADHFPRGRKYAVFLKRLLTPILGILAYHLEKIATLEDNPD